MALFVDNPHSLHCDLIKIKACNLDPHSLYELRLRMKLGQGTFGSNAVFKSDCEGVIDVCTQAPLRGSYGGVRQMGLFESLEPFSDFRVGGYTDWKFPKPWNYELTLHDNNGLVSSVELSKNFVHSAVERIEVEEERVRGAIYKPKGDGPFPTILDITGTGGGLREHRAAALAGEGFCVLALAFFSYKDLPETLTDVEVEYFMEAIEWLTNLPYTSSRIGIQGNSFGGALVLLLPKYCPQIKAVVSINGPHVLSHVAYVNYKGFPLPSSEVEADNMVWINNRFLVYDRAVKLTMGNELVDLHPDHASKDVEFRFVVSLDDQSTASMYTSNYYSDRLRKAGFKVEVHALTGGHLMEPPYFPHHLLCYSKFSSAFMAYGGEASLHGISQPPVWDATVDFFRRTLPTSEEITQSKL